ncbi:gas vesicle structural protein GvpA [Streptomyces sp. WAC 00631]|uniref:gas vesicle structural protein GvpA n=1 Tax=unclassified Streptomyces TaxID=2593676 RepID=UPI000F770875|nr:MULTISPECIES: gas vesicle structural protein GvpA [unclassified Streptomyces]MCC5037178.1 gas vesicle structural protein GvpA [Streptomyces sp. WAC 00631]MCC9737780.1 gas vesicle structural protein GvpA [Streptomyces sp. MNU89]
MTTTTYNDGMVCVPRAGTLYDTLELILDRGMVIDIFLRVSLVGIEILKIDARIVVASVDTYLRFAEACNRLDLESDNRSRTVPELFGGGAGVAGAVGRKKTRKAAGSLGEKVRDVVGGESEADEGNGTEAEERPAPRKRTASRRRTESTASRGTTGTRSSKKG